MRTVADPVAVLSVLLRAVGLYGVVSFSGSRSTHEFGILTSLALARALDSLLYEVDPLDGPTFASAVVVVACLAPAARAAAVDPSTVLRHE